MFSSKVTNKSVGLRIDTKLAFPFSTLLSLWVLLPSISGSLERGSRKDSIWGAQGTTSLTIGTSRSMAHVPEGRQAEKRVIWLPDPATGESRGCVNLGVYSSKCSFCISYFELIFGHSQMFSGYRIWDWKYNGGLARSMILMLEANVRGAILTWMTEYFMMRKWRKSCPEKNPKVFTLSISYAPLSLQLSPNSWIAFISEIGASFGMGQRSENYFQKC